MKTNETQHTTQSEEQEQRETQHTTKEYKDVVPTLSTEERAFLGGFLYAKLTDLRMRA